MTVITDTDALAGFCERQKDASFIAVDTEFMRERTYWPILCLVQVAGPQEASLPDLSASGGGKSTRATLEPAHIAKSKDLFRS